MLCFPRKFIIIIILVSWEKTKFLPRALISFNNYIIFGTRVQVNFHNYPILHLDGAACRTALFGLGQERVSRISRAVIEAKQGDQDSRYFLTQEISGLKEQTHPSRLCSDNKNSNIAYSPIQLPPFFSGNNMSTALMPNLNLYFCWAKAH